MKFVAGSASVLFLALARPRNAAAIPCAATVQELRVSSTEEAAALADAVNCTGGQFVVQWSGHVIVAKTISIFGETMLNVSGSGAEPSVIHGGNKVQLFKVYSATLNLHDLGLEGGSYYHVGGAISSNDSSMVTVSNCSFSGNEAEFGGAVSAMFSTALSLRGNNEFFNNTARSLGGAVYLENGALMTVLGNNVFRSNTADSGGAIMAQVAAEARLQGGDGDTTVFINNNASTAGGGVHLEDRSVFSSAAGGYLSFDSNYAYYVEGGMYAQSYSEIHLGGLSSFTKNVASFDDGGGIYMVEGCLATIPGSCTFENNSAVNGGAVAVYVNSTLDVVGNVSFVLNSANSYGGALAAWNLSAVGITGDSTFDSNTAVLGGGGAAFYECELRLEGEILFVSNISPLGGAVHLETSALIIDSAEVVFSHNNFSELPEHLDIEETLPGAIYVYSHSLMRIEAGGSSSFESNGAMWGGAIALIDHSELHLQGTATFTRTVATLAGGAIFVANYSSINVTGSALFESNMATTFGGAIMSFLDSSLDMANGSSVNLVRNSAKMGGALYVSEGQHAIVGAYFAFNTATYGGAVYIVSAAIQPVSVDRCTFVSNVAEENGGALLLAGGGIELRHCEFRSNFAGLSGSAVMAAGNLVAVYCAMEGNQATAGPAVVNFGVADLDCMDVNSNTILYGDEHFRTLPQYDQEIADEENNYDTTCVSCGSWEDCMNCTIDQAASSERCTEILPHTGTTGVNSTLETLRVDPGFWRTSQRSTEILACYNEGACAGGVGQYCAEGYTGPFCAVCESEYSAGMAYTCTLSSTRAKTISAAVLAVLCTVALAIIALAVWHLVSPKRKFDTRLRCSGGTLSTLLGAIPVHAIKVVIATWQIVTQFSGIAAVSYPDTYDRFLSSVAVFNLNLSWMISPGCIVRNNFYHRLLMDTLGPIFVMGILALTYMVAVARAKRIISQLNRSTDGTAAIDGTTNAEGVLVEAIQDIRQKHLSAVLLVTFLVYSPVSSVVFKTFGCDDLDNSRSYLRADHSLVCYDENHKLAMAYAGIMAIVYPLGIPLLYACLLYSGKKVLTTDSRTNHPEVQPFRDLWEPYKKESYFYEVVECIRRVTLTGVVVFIFPNDSAAQISSSVLLALFFTLTSEVLNPYETWHDTWLARLGHVVVVLSFYVALLLRVEVSEESDQSQAWFSGVLVVVNAIMIIAVVCEGLLVCFSVDRQGVHSKRKRPFQIGRVRSRPSFALEEPAYVEEQRIPSS